MMTSSSLTLAIFGMGMPELVIIGIVAVLLFGSKLPEVARSLGGSYREFKKGLSDIQANFTMDTYHPPSSSSSSSYSDNHSYEDYDDYDDATAPKFAPPPTEPQDRSPYQVDHKEGS